MTAGTQRLLCISNGHGEDAIALQILQALPAISSVSLAALPLVGDGRRYWQQGIPLVGDAKVMPSGGFINQDGRQLLRDLRGGLATLTLAQLRAVRDWAADGGAVLAVGDLVPLLFGWLSGLSYGFVGTAKSDYYWRNEQGLDPTWTGLEAQLVKRAGSFYLPWERWLLRSPRCRCVFPRDRLTTLGLQRHGVAAFDLGNPMMDGLNVPSWEQVAAQAKSAPLRLVLLPGSRPPEAYHNWQQLLAAAASVQAAFDPPLEFLAAIAPGLALDTLESALLTAGWQPISDGPKSERQYQRAGAQLRLSMTRFADYLQQAQAAIAMAGTATEQFAGLGKPALTLPGAGPQFTPAFAQAQTRLLGCSVTLVDAPAAVGSQLSAILADEVQRQQIYRNGVQRLGPPGASQRIAEQLQQSLRLPPGSEHRNLAR
ncbi:MAG: hypothetical protein F6J97_07320 [Leptolyngbya sp. SIO4C1]|nr:hypothetical protein [Leptolyngbya sp. SIO4C1]